LTFTKIHVHCCNLQYHDVQ